MISFSLPIRTVNALNAREHWSVRSKRAKTERLAAEWITPSNVTLPCVVTLTRVAPRMMDDDGSIASLKNVRDGVADRIGVDDGGTLIVWKYAQRKGKPYAVEIEIDSR